MDMFSGIDNEVVMDVKDYIREKCGDNIASHIEFYISFYENILTAYGNYDDLENDEQAQAFSENIECEL